MGSEMCIRDRDNAEWRSQTEAKIIIDNPKFFEELNTMMEMGEHGLEEFKWCMINNVFNSVGGYLDDESYDIIFDYYGRVLSGQKEQKPRWKRVLSSVQNLGRVKNVICASIWLKLIL